MSIVLLTDEYNDDDDPIEHQILIQESSMKGVRRKGGSEEWRKNKSIVECRREWTHSTHKQPLLT